ncbi:MAG: carbamoyltransferase HypF [Calditrichaeota bacterium]|nr:carbamoyltransferase HypF [Calditrichota bacterium]
MKRQRVHVNGIVQGVGFRPFVFNLARRLQLGGFVTNTGDGVIIEVEGRDGSLDEFLRCLQEEKPPLSEIIHLERSDISPLNEKDFRILASVDSDDNQTLISPDIAVCDDCLRELRDPLDRRYRYPFINCTNCGPRFTIIRRIPYDRPHTSMAKFTMCSECQAEYDDPANRRFHAQPNACGRCGPQIWYESAAEEKILARKNETIERAVTDLLNGKIVAIKGLGGFHLAVDAVDEQAVKRLRRRKNREEKPFALMLPDLGAVEKIAELTPADRDLLTSPRRPIVLLKKKEPCPVAEDVAPQNQRLGIMLPYTPLHYLIFDELIKQREVPALVMTSANRSDEPIVTDNDEARTRLGDIADYLLLHDRPILIRADDSVVARFNGQTTFFRRSRGYVPRPVFLSTSGPSVLATGGELKNTVCITKKNRAFLSQHIGDLENLLANNFFEETVEHFLDILQVEPELVVCDLHPGYFSTQWAETQKKWRVIKVQHHHAHLASCMAEWRLDEPVIGVILDGTGYGYDQTIWGGEILIGDYLSIQRFAWFEPLPLPGADTAIKQPWRTAVSYLFSACGEEIPPLPFLKNKPVNLILEMIRKKINSPLTSSCGRLFDAASVIGGGREEIRYEAQAAIEFTQAVRSVDRPPLDYLVQVPQIPIAPLIRSLSQEALKGATFQHLAERFHVTLSRLLCEVVEIAVQKTGLRKVVLSGGVFQNEVLLSSLVVLLKQKNLKVFTHRQVPPNDGGISLGQSAIGQRLLTKAENNVRYSLFNH